MARPGKIITLCLFFLSFRIQAESFRTLVEGSIEVSLDRPGESSVALGINSSALINLGPEARFFKGIELELSAPQAWLSYRGSLTMAVYNGLGSLPTAGIADLEGSRIAFEPLPGKLQIVYQIPLRPSHGLRTTPYATVPAGVTPAASFPILFRLIPVVKGMNNELENMVFQLAARPIVSDEGAVRLIIRYPVQLENRPFTLLIDDNLIENLSEEQLLKEGEHHLVVLSDDYRNESRRFAVEGAKVLDLIIELQDPTPLIIFEGPENALVFLDNIPITQIRQPIPVEPGPHEARFRIGDYTITKTLNIQRGKTYRIELAVDLTIQESE